MANAVLFQIGNFLMIVIEGTAASQVGAEKVAISENAADSA